MALSVVVIQVILFGVVGMVCAIAAGKAQPNLGAIQQPAVLAVVNLIASATICAWGYAANRVSWRELFPLGPVSIGAFGPIVLSVLGLGLVLSEVDDITRMVLPMPEAVRVQFRSLTTNAAHPVEAFLLLTVIAPLTEEPVFRGIILRGLGARYRPVAAILLSSLLFGLSHFNPWQFLGPAALGVLVGWFFLRTHSLVPALFAHALNNALAFGSSFAPWSIPGWTGTGEGPAVHQPWWLTLGGLALLALGVWSFRKATPPAQPPPLPPDCGAPIEPPVLS